MCAYQKTYNPPGPFPGTLGASTSERWIQACKNCAPRQPRNDLAPSPVTPRASYYFFGSVAELRETRCRRCTVIANAVVHFAGMFRSLESVSSDNISVEWDSLAQSSDLFYNTSVGAEDDEPHPSSSSLVNLTGFELSSPLLNTRFSSYSGASHVSRSRKFPSELGVCFRFKDMPERGKVELHSVSCPTTLNLPSDDEFHVKQPSLDIISTWLKECSEKHGDSCAPKSDRRSPSRLLDIEQGTVRLLELLPSSVSLLEPTAYVALSHCWGSEASNIRTIRSNIESMHNGIPVTALPTTFQHAIELTLGLGYRLIWIDSLCIIQDDDLDWQRESVLMADIYKNAVLTIAASRSPDGNGGCFFDVLKNPYIWRRTRQPGVEYGDEQPTLITHRDLWRLHVEECDGFALWFALRPGHDIRDLSHKGNYGENARDVIEMGYPLLSRAWFFQERLLSSRVIQFGHMELIWECNRAFWSNSLWTEFRRNDVQQQGNKEVRYPIERTRRMLGSFMRPETEEFIKPTTSKNTNQRDPKELWKLLVEEYSRLKLTHESDRLPALSGIAETTARLWLHQSKSDLKIPNMYIAGIWSQSLPSALYWTSSQDAYRPHSYRAPTFCWASVEGAISYHEAVATNTGPGNFVCEIVGFSSTPEGLDPHGKVQGGHLEIRSWKGMATVVRLYEKPDGDKETVCVVEQMDKYSVKTPAHRCRRQAFYTDISLRSRGSNPVEVSIGDEVLILLLECVKKPSYKREACSLKALVLKCSKTTSGAFERIGLIRTENIWSYKSLNGWEVDDSDMFYWPTGWFSEKLNVRIT